MMATEFQNVIYFSTLKYKKLQKAVSLTENDINILLTFCHTQNTLEAKKKYL